MIRGFSIFIGSFPNEIRLFNDLMANRKSEYSASFYFYVISIVFLTMGTVIIKDLFEKRNSDVDLA